VCITVLTGNRLG